MLNNSTKKFQAVAPWIWKQDSCSKWEHCRGFWGFSPSLPVSDTCWRVGDFEGTVNCWKIEVKSSGVVLSVRVFERGTTFCEGQVFFMEMCQNPKRLTAFEKQISCRFETWTWITGPFTMKEVKKMFVHCSSSPKSHLSVIKKCFWVTVNWIFIKIKFF